jgi:Carboxypeptidase regulatory-like domain/TonB dependent receptor
MQSPRRSSLAPPAPPAPRVASALAFAIALLVAVGASSLAHAQSPTTGAIVGVVVDARTGAPLPNVIVEASSMSLLGKQRTGFSDEDGAYKLSELPPGQYVVAFYLDTTVVKRAGITVGVQKATPVYQRLELPDFETSGIGPEVILIEDFAPAIDPTSTTQGLTVDRAAMRHLPTPGRTFEDALTAAPGAQSDRLGAAFSGSTSLENQYTVDGMNTTGLRYGASGTSVIRDFVQETEIITGGYNAEYGRSSGAVINVATKSGSNVLAGSVFGYLAAGALAGDPERTQTQGSSIDAFTKTRYDASFGVEVGGPVVKDHVFFFVGFAPRRSQAETTRITKRQVDCRALDPRTGGLSACDARPVAEGGFADGVPDRVPQTQQLLYEDLDRERRTGDTDTYSAIGKLSFALTADHQGQLSLLADRSVATAPGVVGLPETAKETRSLTLDGVLAWTSKFHDDQTELELVAGWHRNDLDVGASDARLDKQPLQVLVAGHLADYAGFGGESQRTLAGCRDGGDGDPYALIANCPMDSASYATGGPGLIVRGQEERRSARLGALRRVRFFGSHELKAGLDVEENRRSAPRLFSGGAFAQNVVGQLVHLQRFVKLAPAGGDPARYDDECRTSGADGDVVTLPCARIGDRAGGFGTAVDGETFNWAFYLRDSFRPLPELTLNLGLRYEEQRLRNAEQLQGTTDPVTGRRFGKNAMVLRDQWAPRLGAIYDFTSVGRGKVYAHWGRYYESIPLEINDRSFGGEVVYVQDFAAQQCGPDDPRLGGPNAAGCIASADPADFGETVVGAGGTLIAPGIRGQYLDESLGGVEYELWDDLVVGVAVQHRRLGRVIEDVSPDGAATYLVANPGSFSEDEERALERRIAAAEDEAVRERLAYELELYRGVRRFDRPQRDYTAVTLLARRPLTEAFYLQASYTYARTRGNYPGTLSYDNNQISPNNSTQYDLIELLGNRRGPLPQDRPHSVKVDGSYSWTLSAKDLLTLGARFRASSGAPITALGPHPIYGDNEVALLPRGALGRTSFDHNLSARLSYARALGGGLSLEVFADVYNLYDRQSAASVDQTYAPGFGDNTTRGISGGSYEDLVWLKAGGSGQRAGAETDESGAPYGPASGNLNFRNATSRTQPIATQLGMRLVF